LENTCTPEVKADDMTDTVSDDRTYYQIENQKENYALSIFLNNLE